MQDFLQHLDVTDQTLVPVEILVEELACAWFVGMGPSHEVHGNVGIDEDQPELGS